MCRLVRNVTGKKQPSTGGQVSDGFRPKLESGAPSSPHSVKHVNGSRRFSILLRRIAEVYLPQRIHLRVTSASIVRYCHCGFKTAVTLGENSQMRNCEEIGWFEQEPQPDAFYYINKFDRTSSVIEGTGNALLWSMVIRSAEYHMLLGGSNKDLHGQDGTYTGRDPDLCA